MRPKAICRNWRQRQRGVAMLEFAIVLPVMLLLTLAVTEIGRAMVRYNTLTKAIQDGVRHGAAYGTLGTPGNVIIDAALEAEIRNLVVYGNVGGVGSPMLEGLDPSQITVSSPSTLMIRVDAAYPYAALFGPAGLPTFGLGSSTNYSFVMQASITMRAL